MPGAGGYGDPLERDQTRVLADVEDGKVGVESARRDYAVAIDKDVRYLLIRPETLIDFQKALERLSPAQAGEILAAGGFSGGSKSARRYRECFGLGPEATARFLCTMGGQIGWGRFELFRLDEKAGELEVEVTGSPFAEAYGQATAPVCHFIRGVLAGLAEVLFGPGCETSESACAAAGARVCRFSVRRRAGAGFA